MLCNDEPRDAKEHGQRKNQRPKQECGQSKDCCSSLIASTSIGGLKYTSLPLSANQTVLSVSRVFEKIPYRKPACQERGLGTTYANATSGMSSFSGGRNLNDRRCVVVAGYEHIQASVREPRSGGAGIRGVLDAYEGLAPGEG